MSDISQWLLDSFSKGELQLMVFNIGIILIGLFVITKDKISALRRRYDDYIWFKENEPLTPKVYSEEMTVSTLTNKTISMPSSKQTNG